MSQLSSTFHYSTVTFTTYMWAREIRNSAQQEHGTLSYVNAVVIMFLMHNNFCQNLVMLVCVKRRVIAVRELHHTATGNNIPYSVTGHPAEVTFLPLPQPKLVLNLMILKLVLCLTCKFWHKKQNHNALVCAILKFLPKICMHSVCCGIFSVRLSVHSFSRCPTTDKNIVIFIILNVSYRYSTCQDGV